MIDYSIMHILRNTKNAFEMQRKANGVHLYNIPYALAGLRQDFLAQIKF